LAYADHRTGLALDNQGNTTSAIQFSTGFRSSVATGSGCTHLIPAQSKARTLATRQACGFKRALAFMCWIHRAIASVCFKSEERVLGSADDCRRARAVIGAVSCPAGGV
jgi:hypothetical protein